MKPNARFSVRALVAMMLNQAEMGGKSGVRR